MSSFANPIRNHKGGQLFARLNQRLSMRVFRLTYYKNGKPTYTKKDIDESDALFGYVNEANTAQLKALKVGEGFFDEDGDHWERIK